MTKEQRVRLLRRKKFIFRLLSFVTGSNAGYGRVEQRRVHEPHKLDTVGSSPTSATNFHNHTPFNCVKFVLEPPNVKAEVPRQ